MFEPILAELKYYNANSSNNDIGDCVVRSLSLAYRVDYDTCHHELNRIKRIIGWDTYKQYPVYHRYIRNHGVVRSTDANKEYQGSLITVQEFMDSHPAGTYVLTCGKVPDRSTHMVCLINGNVYDSWNCLGWYVNEIHIIREDADVDITTDDVTMIAEPIIEFLQSYSVKLLKKMQYASIVFGDGKAIDSNTYRQQIRLQLDSKLDDALTDYENRRYTLYLVIKLSPSLSLEDNLSVSKEKCRVQLREWVYSIRKRFEDIVNASKLQVHPKFYGDRQLLLKLPEWCRSLIQRAYDNERTTDYYQRYELEMHAFDDDPRKTRAPIVYFSADTLSELKRQLSDYQDRFSRLHWDY